MVTTRSFFRGSILIVLAWMATASMAYAAQAGSITRLKGDVFIARPDVPVVTAKGDDAINEGDLVTTAKGAEALIRFKDNTIITLRPDSSMLVKSFRHEEKASDSFLTNLLKGGLRTVTGLLGKTRPESVNFTTPTATQPSETIRVAQRGTDRTETVNQFLDIRFSKRASFGRTNFEGTVDIFNLLNANHVLEQNVALGSTFGRPSRILTPRIVRFGLTARF